MKILFLLFISITISLGSTLKYENEAVDIFRSNGQLQREYVAKREAGLSKRAAEAAVRGNYSRMAEIDYEQKQEVERKYKTDPEYKKEYDRIFNPPTKDTDLPLALGIISVRYLILILPIILLIIMVFLFKNLKHIFNGPKVNPESLKTLYGRKAHGK